MSSKACIENYLDDARIEMIDLDPKGIPLNHSYLTTIAYLDVPDRQFSFDMSQEKIQGLSGAARMGNNNVCECLE